eukprot:483408_1
MHSAIQAVAYFLYFFVQNSSAITQTLSIYHQGNLVNGASIINLSPSHVVPSGSGWDMGVVQDKDQWSLWLKTNNTWGFDATSPSSLSIQISGLSFASGSSLLLSFTDGSYTKYFTILIRLDGQNVHMLSPGCDSTNNPTQRFLNGDVYLYMTDEPTPGTRMCRPAYINSSLPCQYATFGPAATIVWPMIFTLRNYPIAGYSTITFEADGYSAIHCGFGEVFPTGVGTSVYITTLVNDGISISSFRLDYTVGSSYPSAHPTQTPSGFPSLAPSGTPSRAPTPDMSQSPTKYPTTSPTKYPTTSPTKYPTTSPTKYPTTEMPSSTPYTPRRHPPNTLRRHPPLCLQNLQQKCHLALRQHHRLKRFRIHHQQCHPKDQPPMVYSHRLYGM